MASASELAREVGTDAELVPAEIDPEQTSTNVPKQTKKKSGSGEDEKKEKDSTKKKKKKIKDEKREIVHKNRKDKVHFVQPLLMTYKDLRTVSILSYQHSLP